MRSGTVACQVCCRRPRALSRVAFRFPKVLDCEARARSVRPPWSSTFCASLTVYGERQRHVPGIPPQITYPEFTNSIPPPIAGPPPSSEPPLASTRLTVL